MFMAQPLDEIIIQGKKHFFGAAQPHHEVLIVAIDRQQTFKLKPKKMNDITPSEHRTQ